MVRSLIIRQTFVLLDLALAFAVLAAAGVIVFELFQPQVQAVQHGEDRGALDVESIELPQVGGRAAYQVILASRLFGDAGRFDAKKVPPPPPIVEELDEDDIEETALNLTLLGVVHLGEDSPFSSAAIRDNNNPRNTKTAAYFMDAEVVDNVFISKFGKREVILLNKRGNPQGVYERLSMDSEEQVASNTPVRAVPPPAPPSRITLNRNDLIKEMTENSAELMKIQPRLERDKSGRVIGVTADNISKYSLAQKLGLHDGDILQAINGEKIDSQEKILAAINKYRNGNAFRLSIARKDGSSRVVTYTLR